MHADVDELAETLVTASSALVGIAIRSVQAAPVPVTVPQHRVLLLLVAEGPQLIGAIAEQLGVNPSNATRLCDRLQRLSLVRRARSDDDGRAVLVTITADGRRVVTAVAERRRQEVADVLRALSPKQAAAAVSALAAFNLAAHERSQVEWAGPD